VLIVLSGLPGVGKTTIARALAAELGATHVRIDTIEQELRNRGVRVTSEGYDVARATAGAELRRGQSVVADCVNPWPETRDAWREVAVALAVPVLEVEVVCSDAVEHRRRVETRLADIPQHELPAWQDVIDRDYRPWDRERLVIDTAELSLAAGVRKIRTAASL
jgi:predicted kinase